MRTLLLAILFFVVGLGFGLYLPHVPQYQQKYAPQVNEFFAGHKAGTAQPAKDETPSSPTGERNK